MLKESTYAAVDALIARYPALSVCRGDLRAAVETICESFRAGRKLITCGNGGSAADAEHIVGELMKGFLLPRPLSAELKEHLQRVCPQEAAYFSENLQGTLPAMSLVNQIALNTAFANDQAPDLCFAQQILGMGQEGDTLLAKILCINRQKISGCHPQTTTAYNLTVQTSPKNSFSAAIQNI